MKSARVCDVLWHRERYLRGCRPDPGAAGCAECCVHSCPAACSQPLAHDRPLGWTEESGRCYTHCRVIGMDTDAGSILATAEAA
jgi:hypothetical protein